MKNKPIPEALQYVADNPNPRRDPIDSPVWELVCRALYELANSPDPKVRGSMGRATAAQRIILDRLVGRRRPGSNPAAGAGETLEFGAVTVGIIPAREEAESEQ